MRVTRSRGWGGGIRGRQAGVCRCWDGDRRLPGGNMSPCGG